MLNLLFRAEIRGLEQLLQQSDPRPPARGLTDLSFRQIDIRPVIVAATRILAMVFNSKYLSILRIIMP